MDLEFDRNEGNYSTPLFNSIINVMTSMKEATAEKIYKRIQKEGMTNYSKPQVDRALANALKYGIFEVRNNHYRVRDDVLDDEDTIYWKARIKHEETPYRLDSNRGDYINPEKDRRTFRRLSIGDNGGCNSRKKAKMIVNEITGRKGKVMQKSTKTRAVCENHNKPKKTQRNQVPRHKDRKGGKTGSHPQKERETGKTCQRTIRKLTLKDAKKIKRVAKGGFDKFNRLASYEKIYADSMEESDSETFSSKLKDEGSIEDDETMTNCDEAQDRDECESYEESDGSGSEYYQHANKSLQSAYLDYMKLPFPSNVSISRKQSSIYSLENKNYFNEPQDGCNPSDNDSEYCTSFKSREMSSDWNLDCSEMESDLLGEWCSKAEWLGNRPQNAQDGTVKQFDNALKIEPLDPLPFKNIEETSYIS